MIDMGTTMEAAFFLLLGLVAGCIGTCWVQVQMEKEAINKGVLKVYGRLYRLTEIK